MKTHETSSQYPEIRISSILDSELWTLNSEFSEAAA